MVLVMIADDEGVVEFDIDKPGVTDWAVPFRMPTTPVVIPPTPTVAPEPPAPPPAPYGAMTEPTVDAVMAAAEVPEEWRATMKAIGWCESNWTTDKVGDHGSSLGWLQLWHGWFQNGEDPFDAVTSARVAVRVRENLGRWGGRGGWSCAEIVGAY